MGNYISKYAGADIDKAVAYYLAIDKSGRTVLAADVTTTNWVNAAAGDPGKYMCTITTIDGGNLLGLKINTPPLVYFVDGNKKKWDMDYKFTYDQTDAHLIESIVCYSNAKKAGSIIAVTVLSTVNINNDVEV